MPRFRSILSPAMLVALLMASGCNGVPNDPYPPNDGSSAILYTAFAEPPKHLDPARAYSSNEYEIIAQVYEPLYQYHYLKRPYTLAPLLAEGLPEVRYLDRDGRTLKNEKSTEIAFSEYLIRIKPGVRYQPHPAFARDAQGRHRYHALSAEEVAEIAAPGDLQESATRELTTDDFVYAFKRLMHPALHSPVAELMKEHIVGLADFGKRLQTAFGERPKNAGFFDLREFPLEGVQAVDAHTLRIRLQGNYPQFRYWLAMPFFAPMAWEVDRFYSQPALIEKNLTLDWFPVGTGPYFLAENNPNRRMVLKRNPNFHGETYPSEAAEGDAQAGYLRDAGQALPFIDEVVFTLEKETIPYWNKFLQGYYDASGLASDNFDQAVTYAGQGGPELTPVMKAKGIELLTAVSTSTFYMGFNMLDPVVGGLDEKASALRRALSIAVDYEEYIAIFANGRGMAAQSLLPPGLFGYREGEAGINREVYDWVCNEPRRKSLDEAKRLLAEAGYPNGVDAKTGAALVLYLDTTASGPDSKSQLSWYRKQFAKLGIQLVLRTTDYNQFQQKMAAGNAQIYLWGWNADYPDPENFFFLLYGPNAKVPGGGENASNYRNAQFDRLFERMRDLGDGPERQRLVDDMQALLRHDAPWIFGYHPKSFALHHAWYSNLKPNLMANNELKYQRIDPALRAVRRAEWNRPIWWPLVLVGLLLGVATRPGWRAYRARQQAKAL